MFKKAKKIKYLESTVEQMTAREAALVDAVEDGNRRLEQAAVTIENLTKSNDCLNAELNDTFLKLSDKLTEIQRLKEECQKVCSEAFQLCAVNEELKSENIKLKVELDEIRAKFSYTLLDTEEVEVGADACERVEAND